MAEKKFQREKRFFCLVLCLVMEIGLARSQDNYEIQVYASPTQAMGSTMFELHSNYTFNGNKEVVDGVVPSNHSLHETVEITTGITPVFETGVYFFTNYTPGYGYQFVGTHIRPRVMAPAKWGIPFGLSLSLELGYQKPAYASETWSLEIRPIFDKQWGNLYVSVNPTFGIALKSEYSNSVPAFEPNVKISYSILTNAALGLEYYGDVGSVNQFDQGPKQNHALFVTYDLLNNIAWELNIGAGFGLTPATDPFVFKVILGRRIKWK
jgi:hypothetical protein